ncbi:MAG: thiamine pyrophosphate-dependent enzyme [Polyangiaceae bacterium]|jgi:2-oxoisovalerate dehydrogenase E1 component alpha subunit
MQADLSPPTPPTPPLRALRDDGSVDPAHAGVLSDELAVALYEHMVLARAVDERLIALQRDGVIASHASAVGEEAAIVGATAAMHDEDWIFPSSREHAAALWRGMPLVAYAHHAFGTARDAGRGRNAPDPPFWKPSRVASVSPLVGTQIPHAVGVAWAASMKKVDVASLVFFGEGATSSGDFHTGLNFAGVTRAPVVFLCRNNGWATSTPASKQTASVGFAIKAVAYGLRGVRVDGADVVAVLGAVRDARARAASGLGGTLVEAVMPRREGEAPVDPVVRTRQHLTSRGLWDATREQRLVTEVSADVERAIAEAAATEKPARATMFDDVYGERPWHLEDQKSQPHGDPEPRR